MRALNALGFDFGLDVLTTIEQPQAYSLPTSRISGRMVIPVEGRIVNTSSGQVAVTKEIDAVSGKATEVVTDMGGNVLGAKAVSSGIPWLWIAGGLAVAGAFYMMKKKRGGALSGYRRSRRR